jgi:8-amino-7-oxononanoate synthase
MNFGLLSSLSSPKTNVYYDELCHNSLVMGIRNGRQFKAIPFRHNDMTSLKEQLDANQQANKTEINRENISNENLIVVESLYSMDGDICPLQELIGLAEEYDAMIVIDEAHSTGVIGEEGEGLVCSLGLESHPLILGKILFLFA